MSNQATAQEQSRTSRSVCWDGIPLKGIESVKGALQAFADGKSRDSFATTRKLQDDSEAGAMASLLMMAYSATDSDGWMKRLLGKIEQDIKSKGSSHHSFDYDGMGRFFKTTVRVKTFDKDQEIYLLGLNAAYVGSQVEDGLAEALGIEQALGWVTVEAKFPTSTKQFRFDFAEIFAKLKQAVPEIDKQVLDEQKDVTSKSILDDIFTKDSCNDLQKSSLLFRNDKFELSITITNVEGPVSYGSGVSKMVWKRDGNIVTGPIHKGYSDPPEPLVPAIAFCIAALSEEKYNRIPVVDPAIKAQMYELASRIEAAFA